MNEDAFDSALFGHAQKRVEMFLRRMHLTVGNQTHQMKLPAARLRIVHRFREHFVTEEFAGRDVVIDPRDIHANHPAGAHVQMAHLGISHHAVGQTDARAMRGQQRARIFFGEPIIERFRSESDRIALARGRVTPAVDDDERERPLFSWHRLQLQNPER